MKDHAEIHKLLSAYCGGDLDPAEKARVEEHLAACPACRADLADLETALRLIRTTPEVEPPPWLTSRIMARLRDETAPRRRWYQWLLFPARTRLPLEVMALLVVCVSGYYLARNIENRGNAPTVTPEMPATSSPTAEPTRPAGQEPAKAAPSHEEPLSDKLERPGTRQTQPTAVLPAAPKPAEQPAPPSAPAVSENTAAQQLYAPAPPVSRRERAAPASGVAIEAMKAEPKMEQSYRSPGSAPEMRDGAPKAKQTARAQEKSLSHEEPPSPARAPAAQAPAASRLRLAIGDLSSAERLVRQAVTLSGGEIDQASDERQVKVRIRKDRLPELFNRLGRIGRILEKPSLPVSEEVSKVDIIW